MTFDQHDIARALRERADKLRDPVEQANLLALADLIDEERHPVELARWVEDAIGESAQNRTGGLDDIADDEDGSTLINFADVVARPVKWAWRDRIALGKLTALSGRPKVGKVPVAVERDRDVGVAHVRGQGLRVHPRRDTDRGAQGAVLKSCQSVHAPCAGFGQVRVGAPIVASVYALAGNADSLTGAQSTYAPKASLFDVISGSNGRCGSYLCTAGPGYDGPTGNGTPNGVGSF